MGLYGGGGEAAISLLSLHLKLLSFKLHLIAVKTLLMVIGSFYIILCYVDILGGIWKVKR